MSTTLVIMKIPGCCTGSVSSTHEINCFPTLLDMLYNMYSAWAKESATPPAILCRQVADSFAHALYILARRNTHAKSLDIPSAFLPGGRSFTNSNVPILAIVVISSNAAFSQWPRFLLLMAPFQVAGSYSTIALLMSNTSSSTPNSLFNLSYLSQYLNSKAFSSLFQRRRLFTAES